MQPDNFPYWLSIACVITVAVLMCNAVGAGNPSTHCILKIVLTGFTSDMGRALLALFNSEEQYGKFDPREEPAEQTETFRKKAMSITNGATQWIAEDLACGVYAVASFHDVNNNKKLDTNLFGVPRESYGFSSGVRGRLNMPKYKEVSFKLQDALTELTIAIK
jgi:uncharacterized protein (DUF2141 family)